jgi:hypothetical protein
MAAAEPGDCIPSGPPTRCASCIPLVPLAGPRAWSATTEHIAGIEAWAAAFGFKVKAQAEAGPASVAGAEPPLSVDEGDNGAADDGLRNLAVGQPDVRGISRIPRLVSSRRTAP